MTEELPAAQGGPGKTARLKAEHIVTLYEAAELFPPDRRPTVGTILGWCLHGKAGHKLEYFKGRSGQKRTTIEAVRRFRDATGLIVALLLLADFLDDLGELFGS